MLPIAGSRHGMDRSGSVGPNSATTGVRGGGGNVQRAAVAANVERGAPDQRAQFRQVELAGPDNAVGRRRRPATRACAATASAASASDGPEVMMMRRARIVGGELRRHLGERRRRPAAERIAGADVQHDRCGADSPTPAAARRAATRAAASASTGITTGSRGAVGRLDAERRRAGPTGSAPNAAAARAIATTARAWCNSTARPGSA